MAEVRDAYPLLQKQWDGKALRLTRPGRRGWPDFLLIDTALGRVAFAEDKAGRTLDQCSRGVTMGQRIELESLASYHLQAGLLALIEDDRPHWVWQRAPFTTHKPLVSLICNPVLIWGDPASGLTAGAG